MSWENAELLGNNFIVRQRKAKLWHWLVGHIDCNSPWDFWLIIVGKIMHFFSCWRCIFWGNLVIYRFQLCIWPCLRCKYFWLHLLSVFIFHPNIWWKLCHLFARIKDQVISAPLAVSSCLILPLKEKEGRLQHLLFGLLWAWLWLCSWGQLLRYV